MQLERHGVEFIQPDPRLVVARARRAGARVLDRRRAHGRGDPRVLAKDADAVPGVLRDARTRSARFSATLLETTPPSIDAPSPGELWDLLKTGRRFRALGRTDGFRLLRWGPMAVADLVAEWFETELLQAAVAARGIFGTAQGPGPPAPARVLLLNAAVDPAPGGSSVDRQGRAGRADARHGGRRARGGRRDPHRRRRSRACSCATAARPASCSTTAREIQRARGRLERRSAGARSSASSTRSSSIPASSTKMRNYRCPGTVAKVNLALSAPAGVPRRRRRRAISRGRIHIGPDIDYLERAFDASKYGEISPAPYLDITIPSLHDPSLAPAGTHVMSVYVQYAPYTLAERPYWTIAARRARATSSCARSTSYAPGIDGARRAPPGDHAASISRQTYGLTGGHIFHGELALDQLFTMRPMLGWAQYRTPIAGLYLCGAGTHPGGGLTGGSGQNAAREILKDLKAVTRPMRMSAVARWPSAATALADGRLAAAGRRARSASRAGRGGAAEPRAALPRAAVRRSHPRRPSGAHRRAARRGLAARSRARRVDARPLRARTASKRSRSRRTTSCCPGPRTSASR